MITANGLREAGANLVAAGLYLFFAAAHVRALAESPRASLLVVVGIETLVAALFLLRAPAARASFSPYSWVTALGGTLAPSEPQRPHRRETRWRLLPLVF